MVPNKFHIGIDTSCYTTSIAAVDNQGEIILDERIMLEVCEGARGLRQSDGVFLHNRNLQPLVEKCISSLGRDNILSITASSKPRDEEDSYMPVFTVGLNTAKVIACCLNITQYEISHQENHILAGVWTSGKSFHNAFLAYHISGGTSELLLVKDGYKVLKCIGGSRDLNAGQFIDRIGVAMGLSFPCGKEMDKLASTCASGIIVPTSVDGCFMSFSGPESHVQRLIEKELNLSALRMGEISLGVFLSIAKSIEKTLLNASRQYEVHEVLLAGGVASNSIIREYLLSSVRLKEQRIEVWPSAGRYAPDNALGCALFGRKQYLTNGGLNE